MSFTQIICFLLLGSFVVGGPAVKDAVYRKIDTNPLSQSMKISWYQFLTKERSLSSLEQSEQAEADPVFSRSEEDTEENLANDLDRVLFVKGINSKEKLFRSLVTGEGRKICYGVCSSDVGFCNGGCKCRGGMCTPTDQMDRLVPHYGSSRPVSTNEVWNDNSLRESQFDYFLESLIGSNEKFNAELPDCYWTGCVEFNHATCADGYKQLTKEKCGDLKCKYVLNCQKKYCCKQA